MSKTSARRWQDRFSDSVLNSWYGKGCWTRLLLPLSWLFSWAANRRRDKYLKSNRWEPPVPVVIVGNISVGGTGKTPVVSSLVKALQSRGYKPGIASRGFGAKGLDYPLTVSRDSDPSLAGDEPVMLAQQLDVPVMVDPNRVSAAQALIEQKGCNLIITDDGLQHYKLKRHVELLVVDGQRMLGNGYCLPAGPLREPPSRMNTVDQVLVNGQPATDLPTDFDCFYLQTDQLLPLLNDQGSDAPEACRVHAVAGIGNPERFFLTLESLGYDVIPHGFPDHHAFQPEDIEFGDGLPVIMTAKDAVKCSQFARQNHWYLPVRASIPEPVLERILSLIETKGPHVRSEQG